MSEAGFTLGEALRNAALRGRRSGSILEAGRCTDLTTLDREADAVAQALAAAGVVAGDRVALRVRNSAPHLAAIFGIWRLGAVLVPLSARSTEAEVEGLRIHCDAAALLEVDADRGDRTLQRLSAGRRENTEAGAGTGWPRSGGDRLAVIAYTSGTTGQPKGVELTHANLLWAAMAVAKTRRDDERSVAVAVSPLCHVPIFVSHFLARLLTGGTVVLSSFDPEKVVRLVREYGVTDLPLVPAMVAPLLAADPGRAENLVKVTVGSARTPMSVKQELAERFPRAEILEAYGQTEATDGLTMTVGREVLERPGTVGRPHAVITLAILDAAGRKRAAGEPGEIAARGPTVMRGYLDAPERTAEAIRDGWLRTGDLGRIDEDGYLFVEGRLKEVIISGGENVSPEEVEEVLARHPAVAEVAVFGVPHARWGEQVAAAVVARAPLTAEGLCEFARPFLASFKLPRALLLVDRLPRASGGKVQRGVLRESLEREQTSRSSGR